MFGQIVWSTDFVTCATRNILRIFFIILLGIVLYLSNSSKAKAVAAVVYCPLVPPYDWAGYCLKSFLYHCWKDNFHNLLSNKRSSLLNLLPVQGWQMATGLLFNSAIFTVISLNMHCPWEIHCMKNNEINNCCTNTNATQDFSRTDTFESSQTYN